MKKTVKVKVFFKGEIAKGSWTYEFVSEEMFQDYLKGNLHNIRKYQYVL